MRRTNSEKQLGAIRMKPGSLHSTAEVVRGAGPAKKIDCV